MKEMLMQTVSLSLLRLIMDLILPEGDAKRYADLGVGLCVMLCLLRTFSRLFHALKGTL